MHATHEREQRFLGVGLGLVTICIGDFVMQNVYNIDDNRYLPMF